MCTMVSPTPHQTNPRVGRRFSDDRRSAKARAATLPIRNRMRVASLGIEQRVALLASRTSVSSRSILDAAHTH